MIKVEGLIGSNVGDDSCVSAHGLPLDEIGYGNKLNMIAIQMGRVGVMEL